MKFDQDLEGLVWDGQELKPTSDGSKPEMGIIAGVGNSIYALDTPGKAYLYCERPEQVYAMCVVDDYLYATNAFQITVESLSVIGSIDYIARNQFVKSIIRHKDGVIDGGDYKGVYKWKYIPNTQNMGQHEASNLEGVKSILEHRDDVHVITDNRIFNLTLGKFIDKKHYNAIGAHKGILLAADKPMRAGSQNIYILDIDDKMVINRKVLATRNEVTHAFLSVNDYMYDATGAKIHSTTCDLNGQHPDWTFDNVVHSLAAVPMATWEKMAKTRVRV